MVVAVLVACIGDVGTIGVFFQVFPIIHNIWPLLFTIINYKVIVYGSWSLPHLGYGDTRTQYTR